MEMWSRLRRCKQLKPDDDGDDDDHNEDDDAPPRSRNYLLVMAAAENKGMLGFLKPIARFSVRVRTHVHKSTPVRLQ